jgi:hypothetical protein
MYDTERAAHCQQVVSGTAVLTALLAVPLNTRFLPHNRQSRAILKCLDSLTLDEQWLCGCGGRRSPYFVKCQACGVLAKGPNKAPFGFAPVFAPNIVFGRPAFATGDLGMFAECRVGDKWARVGVGDGDWVPDPGDKYARGMIGITLRLLVLSLGIYGATERWWEFYEEFQALMAAERLRSWPRAKVELMAALGVGL